MQELARCSILVARERRGDDGEDEQAGPRRPSRHPEESRRETHRRGEADVTTDRFDFLDDDRTSSFGVLDPAWRSGSVELDEGGARRPRSEKPVTPNSARSGVQRRWIDARRGSALQNGWGLDRCGTRREDVGRVLRMTRQPLRYLARRNA